MIIKKSLLIGGVICTMIGTGITPTGNSAYASKLIAQTTAPKTPLQNQLSPNLQPKSQIKLIALGNQPLKTLRFSPQVGQQETADMQMTMDMSMSINGQPAPSLQMPGTSMKLNAVVNKVEPNGDFHYEFSYTDVDLVGKSSLPPTALATMRSEMKKIEGFKGSAIVDNTGRTKKANFVVPANFDPSLKQMMDQMASSIEQLSAQVPQEAIGKGAKWQVISQVSLNGINLQQTATYELVDMSNDVATMNISFSQQAPGVQKMVLPQMPPGMTMTLQSYNATGSGQAKISLNRIMPISTSIDMNTNAQMQATMANSPEAMTMDQQMSMRMNIESK